MGAEIWNVLKTLLLAFANMWKLLTSPLPLPEVITNWLVEFNLPLLTPLGLISGAFISVLIVLKLVNLIRG